MYMPYLSATVLSKLWLVSNGTASTAYQPCILFKGNDLQGQKFSSIATEFPDQGNYVP